MRESGHQQGQRLTLAARQQSRLRGEPILQPQLKLGELLGEELLLVLGHSPAEPTGVATLVRERHVLLDGQIRARPRHWVLEHPADDLGPHMVTLLGHLGVIDPDTPLVRCHLSRNGVEHRRLARTIGADDRDELAMVEVQIDAPKRSAFIDSVGEKGLVDPVYVEHVTVLTPSRRQLIGWWGWPRVSMRPGPGVDATCGTHPTAEPTGR